MLCNATATFTRRVYRGTENSNSKISTSREDRIFFGACPKSDKMSVVSAHRGEKDRVYIIARRARNIFAEYIVVVEYTLVVVLYKYEEKILL